MTTRPYSELIELVEAFAGSSLGTQERNRLKALFNRRAKKAYRATNYWPRFLKVGEERAVSADGLVSFTESNKLDIDTVLRVHAAEPFFQNWSREYEFFVHGDGAKIISYTPRNHSTAGAILISGDAAMSNYFDFDGEYTDYKSMAGLLLKAPDQVNGRDVFSTNGTNDPIDLPDLAMRVSYDASTGWEIDAYFYGINRGTFWAEGFDSGIISPVDAVFMSQSGGNLGTFTVSDAPQYSAFVTYKSALSSTYGDGINDESNVPEEWFDYMAYGGYADWLRGEGQTQKAIVEEAGARDILDDQLEKISSQHIASQVAQRINTHANAQNRY